MESLNRVNHILLLKVITPKSTRNVQYLEEQHLIFILNMIQNLHYDLILINKWLI
jgi:hypothetical protein